MAQKVMHGAHTVVCCETSVTSVGVISGVLRGCGVGVGLGGKSGLVWV